MMADNNFEDLEASLNEMDLGITPQDGALERFGKRLLKNVIKKCLKDRSGEAFYKVSHTLMKIVSDYNPKDFTNIIKEGFLLTNSKSLHQAYKCLDRVLTDHPEATSSIIEAVVKSSIKKENDETSIKDIFALCEKISIQKPEYKQDLLEVKSNALKNLCINSPSKGMMAISTLVSQTYPSKDDLSIIYDGFEVILSKSNLNKQAYPPMLKLLEECGKSGYNTEQNRIKLNKLCEIIQNKNPEYKEQITTIQNNANKQKFAFANKALLNNRSR